MTTTEAILATLVTAIITFLILHLVARLTGHW